MVTSVARIWPCEPTHTITFEEAKYHREGTKKPAPILTRWARPPMLTVGAEASRMRSGANGNANNGSALVSCIGIDGRDRRRFGAFRILFVRSRQAQANSRE